MANPLMGPALIQTEREQVMCSTPKCGKFMHADAVCICRGCGDPFCSQHVDDFDLAKPTCLKKCGGRRPRRKRIAAAAKCVRLERVG